MAARMIKLEGYKELNDALLELPKATQPNVLKRALNKAAEPIEHAAEIRAPYLSGHLRRSVTISNKLSSRQRKIYKKVSKVEVFVGPRPLVQAITQEFGTVNHRPQPFMRPAFLENWKRSLDKIKEDLADEIEKARKRVARKTARLLAKKGG